MAKMKQCWICRKWFDRLSKEHIIPRLFEGYVTTDEFSCSGCNAKLGAVEQDLTPLSILMQNLDNAKGEPTNIIPKGESAKKARKWSYGDKPGTELSTTGRVTADGWERPPGKMTSGSFMWRPGRIPIEVSINNMHKSMLKAIMALACHIGFPQHLFEVPLAYLAGNDDVLPIMQPTSLGVPIRGIFARVWILAPPTKETMTVYGAVAYGPLINLYRLFTALPPAWPFSCELRSYSKQVQCHDEIINYMKWRSTLLEEIEFQSKYRYVGRTGAYSVRESRYHGLVVLETTPSGAASGSNGTLGLTEPLHPLVQEYGHNIRFENWVKSVQSGEQHARFLQGAREVDARMQGLASG